MIDEPRNQSARMAHRRASLDRSTQTTRRWFVLGVYLVIAWGLLCVASAAYVMVRYAPAVVSATDRKTACVRDIDHCRWNR